MRGSANDGDSDVPSVTSCTQIVRNVRQKRIEMPPAASRFTIVRDSPSIIAAVAAKDPSGKKVQQALATFGSKVRAKRQAHMNIYRGRLATAHRDRLTSVGARGQRVIA